MPLPAPTPVISPEADRVLGRVMLRYALLTLAVLIAASFGMAYAALPFRPLFHWRAPVNVFCFSLILIPFWLGVYRVYATRLEIGREMVQRQEWRTVVAALSPLAGPTQRFLDRSGEVRALLAAARAGERKNPEPNLNS